MGWEPAASTEPPLGGDLRGRGATDSAGSAGSAGGAVLGRYPTRPFDARRLAEDCYICQPAAFVRRDSWAAAGGLDASLHFALDYDLWIRRSREVKFEHVEKSWATARMHRENKTLGSRGPPSSTLTRAGSR